ncbi:MAG: leucine-rich repeat domain-containing protein, partial [Flavobacteriaceae bacterium]|nr:leucine-rich repeat domain-containing protein [Flavobacteriaceae bacterium]
LTTPVNWTNFMTEYNLNSAKEKAFNEKTTDLDYLLCDYRSLDELNIEALEDFLRKNPEIPQAEKIQRGIDEKFMTVLQSDNRRKWRGKRLYDWYIKRHLKSVGYKPKYAEVDNGEFFPELASVQILEYNLGYGWTGQELKKRIQNLQKYKNTEDLRLRGRNDSINSLQFLDSLPKLETLFLGSSLRSKDFELKGCPQLQTLYLQYDDNSLLKIASPYPNLRYLHISSDKITQMKGWENVAKLKELDVEFYRNAKIDITPLKELELLSLRALQECKLHDTLPSLHTLKLTEMTVDFKMFKGFPNLKKLDCYKSLSVDLSGIEQLKGLKELYILSNSKLKSIEALKGLKNLEILDLQRSNVSDISVLKELKSLKYLDIKHTPIEDFSVLYELPNLAKLYANRSILIALDLNRLPKNIVIPDYPKSQKTDEVEEGVEAVRDLAI